MDKKIKELNEIINQLPKIKIPKMPKTQKLKGWSEYEKNNFN